jgi:DBP10CT (NUC160) domain
LGINQLAFLIQARFTIKTYFSLSVKNFEHAARKVGMDVMGDEEKSIRLQDRMKRWDSKKKKMVGPRVKPFEMLKIDLP